MRAFLRFALVLLSTLLCVPCSAQSDPCAAPTFPKLSRDRNMFNEQQEEWLGSILDEQFAKPYNFVEDPEGNYLQAMGEHILAQLPPTGRKYHFYIIDAPVNNAFSLGGSNIYVTRQLITFIRNEDEFAGLLGHEIGHIITRQISIDVTRMFRKALGVQQVGDRKDIFDKWNQVMELRNKKHVRFGDESREEDEQLIADQIGLYSMTRAGYDPVKLAAFFDRLTETKGKTGNAFTDFFGATNPNSKRLRELISRAAPLPPQCLAPLADDSRAHFLKWQQAVLTAKRATGVEQVRGILNKATLQPPLRGNLEYLQFSPDGKYLLAQDESNVFVLSREPLANLFRIDAVNALWAQFSPDSRSVVVADRELRVELWDIASEELKSVHAVSVPGRCRELAVSATGDTLACLRRYKDDFALNLLDVASGATIFTKPVSWPELLHNFFGVEQSVTMRLRTAPHFHMQFSPDGHYFVLGSPQTVIGYDLQSKKELSLPGRIRQIAAFHFTFMPDGNIAGLNPDKPSRSQLARFPSGELIQEFPLEVNGFKLDGQLIAPPKGNYILVAPAAMYPIAAIDLDQKQLAMGYRTPGLAIYDKFVAGEELGGRVSIFRVSDKQAVASVRLPLSYLATLESSEFSPDGKWLAAAGRTSGGIWSAETGQRSLDTGTFTGGFFDEHGLIATFHKFEEKPKVISLDPQQKSRQELFTVEPPAPEKKGDDRGHVWQAGDLMIAMLPYEKGHFKIEAHDARTYQVRWSRSFPAVPPSLHYSRQGNSLTAVFEYSSNPRDEAKTDPELERRFNSMPNKNDAILVEVLDTATGKSRGGIFLDSGNYSFLASRTAAAGDTVLINDTLNRTLVCSLKNGQVQGKLQGRFRAISAGGDRILVEHEKGVADLYSTASLEPLAHYIFPARITHAEFASDGTLLLLTADQTIYRLKTETAPQNAALQ